MSDDEQGPVTRGGEPSTLAEAIRRAAATQGVEVGEPSGLVLCVGTGLALAQCDVVVERRGDSCPACAEATRRSIRMDLLVAAKASLPKWPHARFDNPAFVEATHQRLRDAAFAWRSRGADGTPRNLVMLGKTALGKTHCALAVCHRVLDLAGDGMLPMEKFRVAQHLRWSNARDLAASSRQHRLGGGVAPEMRVARQATILVLDELGYEARPRNDSEEDEIASLLDHRYTAGLSTIMTSGRTYQQLGVRYGDATRRRFTERATVVDMYEGTP